MNRAHYQDLVRRRLRAGETVTRGDVAHEMQLDGMRYVNARPILDDIFKGRDELRPQRDA